MTALSVNVNKVATLRNSRGKNNPDVIKAALDIVKFGAQGITVHPRPDGRHIRKEDVYALKKVLSVELNIEGYPSEDFLKMIEEVKPAQCTLVPDPPEALTSSAGWQVIENQSLLEAVSTRLKAAGVRVSVFVDPTSMLDQEYGVLKLAGVDRVELFTERFAERFGKPDGAGVTAQYRKGAQMARKEGLGLNAGHDLSLENLAGFIREVPWVEEVSIGHALICDALYYGLEASVQKYLAEIKSGTENARKI